MNYNVEYPKERGYWYDVLVKEVKTNRRGRNIIGNVYVGVESTVMKNCNMQFLDDIFKIEPYKLLSNRTPEENTLIQSKPTTSSNDKKLSIKFLFII